MTQKTSLASDGPDPRKIVGLILVGSTIYTVAKGRKVSPLAVVSAVLSIYTLLSE
jgi:hypothetical protein